MKRRAAFALGSILFCCACATPPRPTEGARKLSANEPAVVEGRVTDRAGRPVAGIRVEALPRGKDIEWSPPATTDSQGRFRLSLFAPAAYGFVLSWRGITVITPEAEDPARLQIAVQPGERREGVELIFLREAWEKIQAGGGRRNTTAYGTLFPCVPAMNG